MVLSWRGEVPPVAVSWISSIVALVLHDVGLIVSAWIVGVRQLRITREDLELERDCGAEPGWSSADARLPSAEGLVAVDDSIVRTAGAEVLADGLAGESRLQHRSSGLLLRRVSNAGAGMVGLLALTRLSRPMEAEPKAEAG